MQKKMWPIQFVKEAEEEAKWKSIFLSYLDTKGVYTTKDQLAIHKLPYYNKDQNWIEFSLDNFEQELVKQRITYGKNQTRVDLVHYIGKFLKAGKYKGKFDGKSCVSWKIEGKPIDDDKLIWEGECIVIDDAAKLENE